MTIKCPVYSPTSTKAENLLDVQVLVSTRVVLENYVFSQCLK